MSVSVSSPVQNAPNKLISKLFSQKQIGKYCDIQLKFGSVVLCAHACVVGSFSAFVDNLVTSGQVMTSMCGKIPVVNVPLNTDEFLCQPCASKVIEFMYLGKIQIDDDHLEHIRIISCGLLVVELQKICEKHFEKCAAGSNKTDYLKDIVNCGNTPILDKNQSCSKGSGSIHPKEESEDKLQSPSSLKKVIQQETSSNVKVAVSSASDDTLEEKEWAGLTCPVCHVTFMSIVKFQQHSSTHLGKIYTTCFVCSYASLRVSDLIKHLQEKDHGETVCSLCLYEASSNRGLKEHLQQHDHSQPFFCLTCNTRFQTRTALNSHIVKHSSETPHRCNECGRGFKWKHGLQSHMVTHTSVKKLLCDQCGFSTAHLKSFIDHKSVHSGETFKCPIADCKFKSVRKESVKQHLSTHSKEKPYQCEICGQAFSQAKNLRRHAAIHDPGVDPEQCPFCPFQTTRSDKFRDHFRRSHKSDGKDKALGKSGKSITPRSKSKKRKNGTLKNTSVLKKTSHGRASVLAAAAEKSTVVESTDCACAAETQNVMYVDSAVNQFQLSCPDKAVINLVSAGHHQIVDLHPNLNVAVVAEQSNSLIISPSQASMLSGRTISNCSAGAIGDQPQTEPDAQQIPQITSMDNSLVTTSDNSHQQLFIYNDSVCQMAPCTLFVTNEGKLLVSDGRTFLAGPESDSLNLNIGTVSSESLGSNSVLHSSDTIESEVLSLACHENLNNPELCEQETPNNTSPDQELPDRFQVAFQNVLEEDYTDFSNEI